MKRYFRYILIGLLLSACQDKKQEKAATKPATAASADTESYVLDKDGNLAKPVRVNNSWVQNLLRHNNKAFPINENEELYAPIRNAKLIDAPFSKKNIEKVNMQPIKLGADKGCLVYLKVKNADLNPVFILDSISGGWQMTFFFMQQHHFAELKNPQFDNAGNLLKFEQEDWDNSGNAIINSYYKFADGRMHNCLNLVTTLVKGYDFKNASFVRYVNIAQDIQPGGDIQAHITEKLYQEDKSHKHSSTPLASLYDKDESLVYHYDIASYQYAPVIHPDNSYTIDKLSTLSLSGDVKRTYLIELEQTLARGSAQQQRAVQLFMHYVH